MFLAGSNYSETLSMGKDVARDARIEDVEEGEISDSASVEEISKEDFNKQQREVVVVKETSKPKENTPQNNNTRVWTMTDLYKYQSKGGYVSGLYNLAWAQAVQNKPLNEIFGEVKGGVGGGGSGGSAAAAKEVIDVEEGELEEGEIDLDSRNVVDDDDDDVEKKVKGIVDELESFGVGEDEKSFEICCGKLECLVERVRDVVVKCSGDRMDAVAESLVGAIQNVNLAFGLMTEDMKEQNNQLFSRLLSIVNTNDPPFLNEDQNKEIEAVIASLESSKVSSSARDGEKQNEAPVYVGVNSNKIDTFASSAGSESAMMNVLSPGADYFCNNKPNTSLDVPKPGINLKSRLGLLPLLDLHKDHDADSLPSPTRETAPQIPVHKPMVVGDGINKPGISVPKSVPNPEAPKMHPYETDALKAVSSYQQKFGRNSFFMSNRLPSPTPSEESGGDGEGDTGGEVSSSSNVSNVRTINLQNLGQQVVCPPHIESSNLLSGIAARRTVAPSTVSVPTVKSTAKSRDPRLRFLNSDASTLDQNQRALPSVNNMPKVDPVVTPLGSRKQKIIEDPIVDGPFKRQKNAFGNPGIVRDVKNTTGSGGWLEDNDVSGHQSINRNNLGSDPRRLVNGLNYPSATRNEQVPIAGTSTLTGVELAPVAGNSLPSLPDLLKDIAVNPTMLISLLKMGQQHKLASEAQQKLVDPPKTNVSLSNSILGSVPVVSNTSQSSSLISRPPGMLLAPLQTATKAQQKLEDSLINTANVSLPNSILGAVPSLNGTLQSSSILSRSPAMLHAPLQTATTASQDDSGKIRMKPRDPRRVLHNNSLQRAGSMSSEPLKSNVVPSLITKGTNDNQNALKLEGQAEMKTATSQSATPDISLQFTKSLMNIADIVSVSQPSTTSSVGCQNSASQPVQNKSAKVDARLPILSSDHQAATVSMSEGGARSQNTWGDVEHLFEGYDDHQKAAIQKERARRLEEQKKMFAARKLCLVLDLDHTLLNSAKFVEVDPMHDEILRKKEEQDREKPYRHIFRFPHMGMWTKLRPGIWNFLEKASKLYELHLYTMGNKLYATEMAKVLDPTGVLFNGRVISRGDDGEYFDGDERVPKSKDLEGVLGMESGVVIIDDSVRVWPHNKLNLIVVERYIYFPCSRRQFGLPGPSLLEIDHDERPEDGTLASSLAVIERIHQNFFNHQSLDEADVRNILASEQRKILGGCRIVFSRVFPVGEANPHLHPLWQTAEQFGAVCTNQLDERVTHVVANSLGTDKVNWAMSNGKFVVYPGWVEASALLYRRANEQDFAIKS